MDTSTEGEQQDVHVCKQENYTKTQRQNCGAKGDQGLVWQTDGPGQVQQRIHCNTKSSFCFGWYNPVMPGKIEVDSPPLQVGNSRNSTEWLDRSAANRQPEDGLDTTPNAPSRKIALVDEMEW